MKSGLRRQGLKVGRVVAVALMAIALVGIPLPHGSASWQGRAFANGPEVPPGQLVRTGLAGPVVAVSASSIVVETQFGNVTVNVTSSTEILVPGTGKVGPDEILNVIRIGSKVAVLLDRSPLPEPPSAPEEDESNGDEGDTSEDQSEGNEGDASDETETNEGDEETSSEEEGSETEGDTSDEGQNDSEGDSSEGDNAGDDQTTDDSSQSDESQDNSDENTGVEGADESSDGSNGEGSEEGEPDGTNEDTTSEGDQDNTDSSDNDQDEEGQSDEDSSQEDESSEEEASEDSEGDEGDHEGNEDSESEGSEDDSSDDSSNGPAESFRTVTALKIMVIPSEPVRSHIRAEVQASVDGKLRAVGRNGQGVELEDEPEAEEGETLLLIARKKADGNLEVVKTLRPDEEIAQRLDRAIDQLKGRNAQAQVDKALERVKQIKERLGPGLESKGRPPQNDSRGPENRGPEVRGGGPGSNAGSGIGIGVGRGGQ